MAASLDFGRTHGAPYRGYGYVPLRFGGGGEGGEGTSLGEWEHNNRIRSTAVFECPLHSIEDLYQNPVGS